MESIYMDIVAVLSVIFSIYFLVQKMKYSKKLSARNIQYIVFCGGGCTLYLIIRIFVFIINKW